MPPSPALRCSPGRELRGDNHKRGRSLESGLLFREKDEDLALFNEMQTRERENFLLQSSDDFEDTFSTKLRHFSDFKLGISIPVRGESSELLNADGEKNDYDWLLTPPDTPLFPSLDDEPPPVNVARRGRPRSQPISISRSSTMEKSHRSSRTSASPNRLSPSPRSGNTSLQSRGRPSSAPQSSPTSSVRPATPTRRPSPSPSKPSTPPPRSSTPTPRRMSTGSSSNMVTSGARGTSPIRTSRGNTTSPKIKAWQSNIPGFSLDAPPNLRTSLADRPASYVRGSSPASRNGRDITSKFGRQSMSPTASRSVSSSHSNDRDRFSSHSRGSVASSGDDEIDSIQSVTVGGADRPTSKRVGALSNNRALAFSKKSARLLSPSSAPKGSFDSAFRQMDHRKSPQNMFRPLLSSVPSTTFYVGKGSAAHRAMISRNSSVTTSSNASSDHGTSVALDTEGSDHHQDDMVSEIVRVAYPDIQEEVFAFDKMDTSSQDVGHDMHDSSLNNRLDDIEREPATDYDVDDSEEVTHHGVENTEVCIRCGCRYHVSETLESGTNLCPDCHGLYNHVTVTIPETVSVVSTNSSVISTKTSEEHKPPSEMDPLMAVPELLSDVTDIVERRISNHEDKLKKDTSYGEQSPSYTQESTLARPLEEEDEKRLANQQEMSQTAVGHGLPDSNRGSRQLMLSNHSPNSNIDKLEATGISVLLKRSSSSKALVQGRNFIAATVPYEDLSYTRDSSSSVRSSIGHGSTSLSSSLDFSSARQTETRVQRQLSGKKSDIENYRHDLNAKAQSSGSSLDGISNHARQASGLSASALEQHADVAVADIDSDEVDESPLASQENVLALSNKETDVDTSFNCKEVCEKGPFEHNGSSKAVDASVSELSGQMDRIFLEGNLVAAMLDYEDGVSYENEENFPDDVRSTSDVEASAVTADSSFEECTVLETGDDRVNGADIPAQSSLTTISEIESESTCQNSPVSRADDTSPRSKNGANELQESSLTLADENVASVSDDAHGILEESTVMIKGKGRSNSRSLTLEEATDTILFCSSIVHNLAYQAATIAIEKESTIPLEGSRPTVTILGKSSADRKEPRGRTVGKRTSKSSKARHRRLETDAKPTLSKTENDENADESSMRNVGLPNKMDSVKPPKLESKCNCTIM